MKLTRGDRFSAPLGAPSVDLTPICLVQLVDVPLCRFNIRVLLATVVTSPVNGGAPSMLSGGFHSTTTTRLFQPAATAGIFVAGASRQLIHAHTSGARPRCQLDRLRPIGLLRKRARRQLRGRLDGCADR
jgi:hypothetical protein